MSTIVIGTEVFRPHLPADCESALLSRCLEVTAQLPALEGPGDAIAWDATSRRIERLKQSRPQQAAERADWWLEETLNDWQKCGDPERLGLFASALSTWAGLRRTLGQLGEAVAATHRALGILCTQPSTTRTGFACQRAALVLGDLGEIDSGLHYAEQAVAIHQRTPGGQRHVGTALAGLGAYQLSYRRAFPKARAAFVAALTALPGDEEALTIGAGHGVAYCSLMAGRPDDAREIVAALRRLRPSLDPDQDLRLRWLEAEIAAAAGDTAEALALYDDIFSRSVEVTEAAGAVLVFFDAARLLLDPGTSAGVWWVWNRRLASLLNQLTPAQRLVLEPCLDALDGLELDRELLDRTAVAFKKACNRMLLGLGRAGGAGRPEARGHFAA
ncbi:MAG: hypothetical protein AAGF23_19740 [Acidobacteriota bacterium]